MDKFAATQAQHQQQQGSGGSSRDSSRPCSRGSTPSSSRSSAPSRPPSRPPSRRSHPTRSSRSPDPDSADTDERGIKSDSPCGSEVSLHSAKSATSAKSSASAKSSLSTKSNASSTRSNLSGRSSASTRSSASAKSDKSRDAVKSPGASLKSAGPSRTTKARSPAPTHGGSTPAHTPTRRRSSLSNGSSASSADTSQHNGMANSEQVTPRRTTPPRYTPPRNSGAGTPSSVGTPRHMSAKKPLPVFNSYMSLFQVQEKLKKGEVIEGVLRINPKNYEDAYISAPDGGMDIYIGGVRDRNAALHGDVVVVEIKPIDQWKVLYDQLDQYLDDHIDEKIIVYSPLESNITASVADAASSYNPLSNNTNKQQSTKKKEKTRSDSDSVYVVESLGSIIQCDSDVVVEDEDEDEREEQERNAGSKKKKRRRKGKPSKTQDASHPNKVCTPSQGGTQEKPDEESGKDDNQELVIVLQTEPVKVADELVLLSCPTLEEGKQVPQEDDFDTFKEGVKGVVVPPDQLSECDFTDDESGCSEILDYSQMREDQSFMQAQWEAYKKEFHQKQKEESQEYPKKSEAEKEKDSGVLVKKCFETSDLKQEIALGFPEGFVKEENIDDSKNLDSKPEMVIGKKVSSANDVNIVKKEEKCMTTFEKDEAKENTETTQGACGKQNKKKNRKKKKKKETVDQLQREVEEKIKSLGLDDVKGTVESNNQMQDYQQNQTSVAKNKKPTAPVQTVSSQGDKNFGRRRDEGKHQGNEQKWSNNAVQNKYVRGRSGGQQRVSQRATAAEDQEIKMVGNRRRMSERVDRTEPNIFQIQRLPNWESFVQRTAHVVHILEMKHTRAATGILKLFTDKNPNYALFSPTDNRVPRMKIPMFQCPPDFMARNQDYLARIFLARITQWKEPKFALGELVRDVGAVGDIEAETEAFLQEYGIDHREFPEEVTKHLPQLPWSIPAEEIAARTDLRNQCIFTIDPSTARDLDDAVSCVPLENGNFRVGVHIADVSYFIPEQSSLDIMASQRATSIYLTEKVIPMLPEVLCQNLCSLNPGEDRLAVSVIWELTPDGKILGEWFGRTVIHSCVKLAYEHAQSMIEEPHREWTKEEIPEVFCGYSTRDISKVVNNLQSLAVKLRERRFKNGALRLDQVKISFNLDWETKMPNGFHTQELKESNRLIEEFMLLANITVAHKTYEVFPDVALLRRHPPPISNPMKNVVDTLATMGIILDPTSSGSLFDSINKYVGKDKYSTARLQVITSMCSKPMQFARYFCTGVLGDERLFHHYALNVPLYTHFTSPIRRYADLIVHRLLAAVIDPARCRKPEITNKAVNKKAEHCNDRKQTAKTLQEISSELYMALFIKRAGEMVEEGMVMAILDHSFDVLVLNIGMVKRVYTDKLPLLNIKHVKSKGKSSLTLYWGADEHGKTTEQKLTLFSLVTVTLTPVDGNALKFNAVLVRPS
ncbi:DIS3-like exonuclease 2 isoform X3 [Penaeus indicus]